MTDPKNNNQPVSPPSLDEGAAIPPQEEIGGQQGPEPTRYGDWEKGGRCTDF